MNEEEKSLVREGTAARFLDNKASTLRCWRSKGLGPSYIKIGGSVRYRMDALQEWIEKRTVRPDRG